MSKKVGGAKKRDDEKEEESADDLYYHIDCIKDVRVDKNGKEHHLVKWKDCLEETWVPDECLCDTARDEADAVRAAILRKKRTLLRVPNSRSSIPRRNHSRRRRNSGTSGGSSSSNIRNPRRPKLMMSRSSDVCLSSSSSAAIAKSPSNPPSQEQHATTTATTNKRTTRSCEESADHVTFQEIERIHVNDPTAAERVTHARMLGVPVCLVGHKGWANFAKRWLKRSTSSSSSSTTKSTSAQGDMCNKVAGHDDDDDADDGPLDLSLPHEINVEAMMADIGHVNVPVIQQAYNEQDPIRKHMKASKFLLEHWDKEQPSRKRLYLHQWQFPLQSNDSSSATSAAPAANHNSSTFTKLCGDENHHALERSNILGIDLLKFWLDEPCNDNPFQYLFMGAAKTRSKMHKDDGGLVITIAPIVGIKEVILAHRSDAATCLYHLDADVNRVDILEQFPLASWTKLWKSQIVPGEILVMPEGTYHQCSNVTPCLSYSRFHLDHVNLRAFFESYLNLEDAPELQHDEIIWNAMSALNDRIQLHIHQVRAIALRAGASVSTTKKQSSRTPTTTLVDMEQAAFTLKKLNLIAREFANRFRSETNTKEYTSWSDMVQNVDETLHRFQHRHATKIPMFQPPPPTRKPEDPHHVVEKSTKIKTSRRQSKRLRSGHFSSSQTLHSAWERTPTVPPYELGMVVPDDIRLQQDDLVVVHLLERRAIGTILEVKSTMKAAFVRYERLGINASTTSPSPIEDEYIPFGKLKVPVAGESGDSLCPKHVKKDMLVICHEKNGEGYRAFIQHWKTATFYKIRIDLGGGKCIVTRWLTRDSIAQKLIVTHDAAAAPTVDAYDDGMSNNDDDDAMTTDLPLPLDHDKPVYYEVEKAPRRPATGGASSATPSLDTYKPEYSKADENAKSVPAVTSVEPIVPATHFPVLDTTIAQKLTAMAASAVDDFDDFMSDDVDNALLSPPLDGDSPEYFEVEEAPRRAGSRRDSSVSTCFDDYRAEYSKTDENASTMPTVTMTTTATTKIHLMVVDTTKPDYCDGDECTKKRRKPASPVSFDSNRLPLGLDNMMSSDYYCGDEYYADV
jgi:Cupin-like domain